MKDKAAYLEADAKYLSPALGRVFKIVATRAEGSYLYDIDDTKYLDMTSGIAVNQIGHSHPEVIAAITEQAQKCIHTSCVVHYPANIELAEKLASLLPGDIDSTFFCNSGAEALDGSMKLIKILKPGRNNFIAHRGSFHGRTLAATSVTSSKSSYRKFYDPLIPGINFVNYPNQYQFHTKKEREEYISTIHQELETLFKTNLAPESVAAIFIEPVLGEGGYIPAVKEYLEYLRKICDEHGILLVFDEVQCGMGRTGKCYATEHYGVQPDVLLMAKGLSGGLPLGAFSTRSELMHQMPPGSHGSTYGGNPICCKAALKLIEIMERDKVMDNANARSKQIFDFFEAKYPGSNDQKPGDTDHKPALYVRGLGLMIGLQFESAEIVQKIVDYAFNKQVLLLSCGTYGNVIRLAPDLTISEADTQLALDVIAEAIDSIGS